ncbi:zinc metalloprotease HtpX [Candidatus Woesearchaeota archaeon CG_4_10_14_0_2_um_filter_33_13]|nr:MAG: zinc metalloprotease HtpX [Candidatus Woesearchaeota archaeon CG_4_10_14_0_2_um_filter_33_13]
MGIYEEINSNKRRSYILIFCFLIFIIFLGLLIGVFYGNLYFGIILALVIGTIYFLISYYGGANAILTMTRAKEAQKPEYAHLINTVEGLSIAAGLAKPPKVYVIEDDALNAFATGRDPEHSAITVTTGLLKKLNRLELEGVIAHEMSHIKNFDIRVMMLAAVMVGMTVLLSDFLLRSFLWGRGGSRDKDSNQLTIVFILVGLALAILSPFIGEAIKLAISRKREYLADASGAILTRYPKGLADALKKIKEDPDPLVDHANKATAHLFISTPFRKSKGSFMQKIFSTHPPIDERIARLEKM